MKTFRKAQAKQSKIQTRIERSNKERKIRRDCRHPEHRLSTAIYDGRGEELRWCYECNNQAVG